MASEAHLFAIEPAEMIRYVRVKAQEGDMFFQGKNPPAGAMVDYYLKQEVPEGDESALSLAVYDASGNEVRKLAPSRKRGVNRVVWDLRHEKLPDPAGEEPDESGEKPKGPNGPWVVPGTYRARLSLAGRSFTRDFEVREDPRIEVESAVRREWTATLLELAGAYRESNSWVETALAAEGEPDEARKTRNRELRELRRRIANLYGEILAWTGEPTADQKQQIRFLEEAKNRLR
jgi:hypothetical protein